MNQKSSLREVPQFVSEVLTGNRRNRAVEIDVLADELRGDCGPRAERRPAGPDAVHAAEACFIGKHDAPPTPSGGPPRLPYSIRKAGFLKAFCAARSRLG